MRLAAIDLGTVTSRLLIADVCDGAIRERTRLMRITHLGEGLNVTGAIGVSAIEREVNACKDFLATIAATEREDGLPVQRVSAVATSAMRDAANSDEVLARLREAGLEVAVIAGAREAELSFRGTLSGFAAGVAPGRAVALEDTTILTLDVGGGSTEAILGSWAGSPATPRILEEHSFDIGSRRTTDRFLTSDPPSPDELACARAWTKAEMCGYFEGLTPRPQRMIAVAGTATSAITVRDAMVDYDPWKVHGAVMTAGELENVLCKLAYLDLPKRRLCPGLEPERASVIVGGLLILQVALELAGLDSFTVSETDILHGILLDACASAIPVRAASS
jgi:exopolyphosphatase/guanosine-5'-triphosphate,3'-diphosphate pyrophosphatase